ncbi:hypothetical protein [Brockia lithotrophica]|uniref:Uncharacterized protein n=1 Tax=Brockia lithotrophica TaxID=933949 RepID=A0A660L724_9BACL|nr:hypothetical protein [Brockia lithotrophica]RKQ89125.1 hypothetical protein C7438_0782 [Brockia lithotrophica]
MFPCDLRTCLDYGFLGGLALFSAGGVLYLITSPGWAFVRYAWRQLYPFVSPEQDPPFLENPSPLRRAAYWLLGIGGAVMLVFLAATLGLWRE